MKKCLLSILLATVLLCACAQQTDNTLQTPESSTLVELTVATKETAIETPAPLATESPAPAPTQTPGPAATPAPTENSHTGAYCSAYRSARYGIRCRGESACTGQHELRCCPL